MFAFEMLHLMSMRKKKTKWANGFKVWYEQGVWQSWLALNFQLCWFFFFVTTYLVSNQWNSILFEGTMILYQVGHGFSVATTAETCFSTTRYYNPANIIVSRASNYVFFIINPRMLCCVCSVKPTVGFLIILM